jgi:hypothetical protein
MPAIRRTSCRQLGGLVTEKGFRPTFYLLKTAFSAVLRRRKECNGVWG